jgi:hypothetical protein
MYLSLLPQGEDFLSLVRYFCRLQLVEDSSLYLQVDDPIVDIHQCSLDS